MGTILVKRWITIAIDDGRQPSVTAETVRAMPICALAKVIGRDWKRPYFGAVPYLRAMTDMMTIDDAYGCDAGRTIVSHFLANAQTWKGSVARLVKAELKSRLKSPSHARTRVAS